MNKRSVLIVTYGRSGSTLLMGLLNSLDGYLIRGENRNCFFQLYRYYRALVYAHQDMLGTSDRVPTHPWFNDVPFDQIKERLKNIACTTLCGNAEPSVFGFKEVRYFPHYCPDEGLPDYRTFCDYLDFLTEIFPDCRILFLTRKVESVLRSGWWAENPLESKKMIETAAKWYAAYAKDHANCFAITYEDVVAKTPALKEMFGFLGAPYDQKKVDKVLSLRHSDSRPVVQGMNHPVNAGRIGGDIAILRRGKKMIKSILRRRLGRLTTSVANSSKRWLSTVLPYRPMSGGSMRLDNEYARGDWHYLRGVEEMARFSVVAGYCHFYKPGGAIMEIGCGEGILQERLDHSKYGRFLGLDISAIAIERAWSKCDEKTSFVTGDASAYHPQELFDVIVFNECLEYFADPVALVRRYESFLRPDGLFIASIFGGIDTARSKLIWRKLHAAYQTQTKTIVRNQANYNWTIKVLRARGTTLHGT